MARSGATTPTPHEVAAKPGYGPRLAYPDQGLAGTFVGGRLAAPVSNLPDEDVAVHRFVVHNHHAQAIESA